MGDGYRCRVLADSVGPHGVRLTTAEVRFPRVILAQVRTYGMLSYSVRSSRAVPTKVLLGEVRDDPFVPAVWRRSVKGMVAGEELNEFAARDCRAEWLASCRAAVCTAEHLGALGAAKEHVNRVLEPFAWTWAVVTGTDAEWDHLFAQRCVDDAQPEFQKLAGMLRDSFLASQPWAAPVGDWHLPYVTEYERGHGPETAARLSAARCARVSYQPFDGECDLTAEIERAGRLVRDGHWSPLEHQAMCCATRSYRAKLCGWMSHRTRLGY